MGRHRWYSIPKEWRVYSLEMPRNPAAILVIALVALLGAQLSGIHAHADSHGFEGAVQSTHEHHHDDGDEHKGEVDVQVVDLGIFTAKAVFLLFAVVITQLLLPPSRGQLPSAYEVRLPLRRRMRWRPPLRGPPHSISFA